MNMPVVGDLPLACAATCAASVQVQRMAVEAAVHGDVMLLKQAMLHDPLTAAVCNPEEIWQMTDEMLVAQARWLPQYQEHVPAAQARLDEAERPQQHEQAEKPDRDPDTHRQCLDGAIRLPPVLDEIEKRGGKARKHTDEDRHHDQLCEHRNRTRMRAGGHCIVVPAAESPPGPRDAR